MHRRLFALTLILFFISLSGCQNNIFSDPSGIKEIPETTEIEFLEAKNDGDILLFDRWNKKMCLYNTNTFQVQERMNIDNFMIYEFPEVCPYYTAGHNIDNHFQVIKMSNKTVETILRLSETEGIFPLSFSGEYMFFIKIDYDNSNTEKNRSLVKYDKMENKLIEFSNVHGLVSYGSIINSTLYYTCYNEEDDTYSLFSTDCDNSSAKPNLEQSGLNAGEIFSQNGELFISDKENIFSDNKTFKKASENYFVGDKYLVQYFVDKLGDLSIDVINTINEEKIFSKSNVVGFFVTDDHLALCFLGEIKEIPI